jgi:hypothetical protein
MKNIKKYVYGVIVLTALTTLAMAIPVLADTTTAPATPGSAWGNHMMGKGMGRGNMKPGVFGTVSAVSGNAITVIGKQGFGATATTVTYTVDATNAKIMKNNAAGTVSSIAVGDTIMVQGTVTGANVVATMIRDGQMGKGVRGTPGNPPANGSAGNPSAKISPISGNGQPVIAGSITAISGNTITITNKSNVTYTIDASGAKFVVAGITIPSISNVAVEDNVIVQGTVNGNSVTASSVIDQARPASATAGATAQQPHQSQGFFGSIGSFFARIFGF